MGSSVKTRNRLLTTAKRYNSELCMNWLLKSLHFSSVSWANFQQAPQPSTSANTHRNSNRSEPTNPASASFSVLADDFELYSFHLYGSYWEFPSERRYREGEKDVLTELEEMTRAVIAGNCEQKRGPFWLLGKINVGDYAYKTVSLPKLPIPLFGDGAMRRLFYRKRFAANE